MTAQAKGLDSDDRRDEVAELARQLLRQPGNQALQRIDENIRRAMAESAWDEMSKWHRVRFRLIRLQQERAMCARVLGNGWRDSEG